MGKRCDGLWVRGVGRDSEPARVPLPERTGRETAAAAERRVRMESDRIRMESDLDSTFYHILTQIWIRIRMLSDTMQNGCIEFGYGFGLYLIWNIVIFVCLFIINIFRMYC